MTQVVLEIPGVPPSYNTVHHAHWTVNRREKQDWEQRCWVALLEKRVPRGLELVTATARLFFKQRRRRDEGNFRVILEKALGDVLVSGGYLPDDTPDHYRFGTVECLAPSSVPMTEITLTL